MKYVKFEIEEQRFTVLHNDDGTVEICAGWPPLLSKAVVLSSGHVASIFCGYLADAVGQLAQAQDSA